MRYSVVRYILGKVMEICAALMLLPIICSIIYRESAGLAFVFMALVCFACGRLLTARRPAKLVLYSREGMVAVALSWIVVSICGAIPFVISGDIPNFTDALFETISGFTTTGASILSNVEGLSRTAAFWRSFTHWVGGMGVIVFMLALLPAAGGYTMQLMRAESPGPSVSKVVPKVKESAKILYGIYFGMTVITILALIIARMPVFDALCMAFGAAGTGGFGILNDSAASYTTLQQAILTIAMIAFGVNFNAYCVLLLGHDKREAFRMEEVRVYFGIIGASILFITINTLSYYQTVYQAFHHAAFQVASIITTTGFSTRDFDQWPVFSKAILVLLMFCGACAGSTGGGIKVSRVVILFKSTKEEIIRIIHPKSTRIVRMDDKRIDDATVRGVNVYLGTYLLIFIISTMLLCLDPEADLVTAFTGIAATFNNIGPGLAKVGPAMNYSGLNVFSKYICMFCMLAGRLELYPMLVLFIPDTWKKH